MSTSTSTIFRRVNRRRPCLICGKPDWCSFLRDESISICMRVSEGARKINRCGGAIFIHEDWREARAIDIPFDADFPRSPIAPIAVRDFVYGGLLDLSPAERYRGILILGEKGLLERGFDERHFANFGGLPAGWRSRNRIALRLLRDANDHFQSADSLRGVPGFWGDHRGWRLLKERDNIAPWLLIPVRDGSGRIQAFQIRPPFTSKKGLRYLWLSSANLPKGCGSGSPLHFKFRLADLPSDARIVIVEGVLKADVLYAIHPELYIVATPCVTANREASASRLAEASRNIRVESLVRRARSWLRAHFSPSSRSAGKWPSRVPVAGWGSGSFPPLPRTNRCPAFWV